jgi:16S rRNA (adenine1518-N6/adenine1519-N6)-dimethyltransferase
MDPALNGGGRFPSGEPPDVRRLLREAGLRPRKSLGQNFLVRESALAQVAAAAELRPPDVVLEIGAGVGNLTRHLASAARRVVAVEIDSALLPILRKVIGGYANVSIVAGDVLALPLEQLVGGGSAGGYKVAANIPYYITSAVIRRLMEAAARPERIVLTVQKEVAERICALPGKMSLLALGVQYFGRPAVVGSIPADCFYPVPEVDSAIVRVDLVGGAARDTAFTEKMFRIARAGFSQKRKKLRNTVAGGLHLPATAVERTLAAAGVDPARRAETVSVEEWIRIAEKLELPEQRFVQQEPDEDDPGEN